MRWIVGLGLLVGAFAGSVFAEDVPAEVAEEFRTLDADQSGDVTLAEMLAQAAKIEEKGLRRDFRLADFNADEKLSRAEYLTLHGVNVPDPWSEFAAAGVKAWQELLPEADKNGDKKLSAEEWPDAALREKIRPLGEIEFIVWDANQDGQVDLAEAQRIAEIAYGVRHPDGAQMRSPNGSLVFWSYLRDLDRDGDGAIAEADFVAAHWMGAPKNRAYFREHDKNKDGQLDLAEQVAADAFHAQALDAFRQFDADYDGKLSAKEIGLQCPPVQNNPRLLALTFPAFDEDGDGFYSLREFRLSPAGQLYVTLDLLHQKDANRDGAVTWDEFYRFPNPLFRGLAWEVFHRFDRNGDERLTVEEYDFPVDGAQGSADALAALFKLQDKDASGGLSLLELQADLPPDKKNETKLKFSTMDFDRSGELSLDEFLAYKGFAVPDPWLQLADAAFESVQEVFKKFDRDGDGKLSRQEWIDEAQPALARPFGEIEFVWWDVDRDGHVDQRELRRLVDIAYAVKLPTGEPARWSDGSVLYWLHLKDVDRTEDYALSKLEFIAGHWLGKEKNEALFPKLDLNGDEQLSYDELTDVASPFRVNLVNSFYAFDADLDGRLSRAELLEKCPSAMNNPRGLDLGLAAFDKEGDGFDLNEFRISPLGMLYVTVQFLHKKDTNQDGVIAWSEFHRMAKPLFAGIAWEVFRRYDRDGDGELSPDEYDLPEDEQLKQFITQWQPRVRQVAKTELRYFLAICPLDETQRIALKAAVEPMLHLVTRRVAQANRRVNQGGVASTSDPQGLCIEKLAHFAKEKLPAEIAAAYLVEVEARAEQQKSATVLMIVAHLDRHLLLNEDQRGKIAASLKSRWQPYWQNNLEQLSHNPQYVPAVPNDCVIPFLNIDQKTIWRTLTKLNVGGMVHVEEVQEQAAGDEEDLEFFFPAGDPVRIQNLGPALRVRELRIQK